MSTTNRSDHSRAGPLRWEEQVPKRALTNQPGKEKVKWLLLSIPSQKPSPVDGKKSPAEAVHHTELDDRDAQYDVDCEEQEGADDGEEYGADAHVKYFLFVFSSRSLHENKSENSGLKRNFVLEHSREIHHFGINIRRLNGRYS